ncbi:hypothetical protein SELMODRAFT_415637 [Selaginella moellendorffii]|uniref:Uncharacterized protein n=1 Tax=Selaginella moellendorffii TaxID=88036 RepID=D8RWS1_SELML|nr:hypothetical protein SELMODRAFT_415637 [Selaginella moellendorffii]
MANLSSRVMKKLSISECDKLHKIPAISPGEIGDMSTVEKLEMVVISGCQRLLSVPAKFTSSQLVLKNLPSLVEIGDESFGDIQKSSSYSRLRLSNLPSLLEIAESSPVAMHVSYCEKLPRVPPMRGIQRLFLMDLPSLVEIGEGCMATLDRLEVSGCKKLDKRPYAGLLLLSSRNDIQMMMKSDKKTRKIFSTRLQIANVYAFCSKHEGAKTVEYVVPCNDFNFHFTPGGVMPVYGQARKKEKEIYTDASLLEKEVKLLLVFVWRSCAWYASLAKGLETKRALSLSAGCVELQAKSWMNTDPAAAAAGAAVLSPCNEAEMEKACQMLLCVYSERTVPQNHAPCSIRKRGEISYKRKRPRSKSDIPRALYQCE